MLLFIRLLNLLHQSFIVTAFTVFIVSFFNLLLNRTVKWNVWQRKHFLMSVMNGNYKMKCLDIYCVCIPTFQSSKHLIDDSLLLEQFIQSPAPINQYNLSLQISTILCGSPQPTRYSTNIHTSELCVDIWYK